MTKADRWVVVGALLFGVLIAWLFNAADAVVATGGLAFFWLCASRQWLSFSWRYRIDEAEVAAWKPPGIRLFSSLLALLFGGVWLFCLGGMWQQLPALQFLALGVVVSLFFGPITLFFLWAAGPDEARFDLRRNTYRIKSGFPLFPRIAWGGSDEIAGLYVVGPDRQQQCRVVLAWKQGRRKRSWLADVAGKEAAEAVMREIAARLQVPCGVDALAHEKRPRGAWAQPAPEDHLLFRKPRSYGIVGGVLMALTCLLPLWAALDHSTRWTGGIIPANPALSLVLFPCGPAFLVALSLASPSRLQVDLGAQSYQYRVSVLGLPLRYTGTFQDFGTLTVEQRGKRGGIYSLFLNWRTRGRPRQLLGEFSNPDEAEANRREIGEKIGLIIS